MTQVIKEFHRVHPNWFPSIWYVPYKLYTYLALRLALSAIDRTKLPLEPLHLGVETGESKWFLRLWCFRHKLRIYLAPKLTLSPNRPKQDSIWHTSSKSSIGCIQIDFLTYGTFHANCATILHQDLHYIQTDQIEPPVEPLQLRVPSGASKMVS